MVRRPVQKDYGHKRRPARAAFLTLWEGTRLGAGSRCSKDRIGWGEVTGRELRMSSSSGVQIESASRQAPQLIYLSIC